MLRGLGDGAAMRETLSVEIRRYAKIARGLEEIRDDKVLTAIEKTEDGTYFTGRVARALADRMLGREGSLSWL